MSFHRMKIESPPSVWSLRPPPVVSADDGLLLLGSGQEDGGEDSDAT